MHRQWPFTKKRDTLFTVYDLISEHTLISGHPPFYFICNFILFLLLFYYFVILIIISSDFREGNTNLLYTGLMITMVKTTARAHRDLCVLAALLCCTVSCYCVASCN